MVLPSTIRFSTLSRVILCCALAKLFVITFSFLLTMEIFTVYQGLQLEPYPMMKKHDFKSKGYQDNNNRKNVVFSRFLRKENIRLIGKVKVCDQLLKMRQQKNKQTIQTNIIPKGEVMVKREFFNYLAENLRNTPYPGVNNYTHYTVTRLGLSPLVGVEPLIPEFGPVINDVLSFKYPISVPPCRKKLKVDRTVFVIINSAPTNFGKRKIIRQTWRNNLRDAHEERLLGVAGFAFILGLTEDQETQKEIEKEANTYGDIIQISITDFYRNMSVKVAGLFNWLYRFCAKVEYVVKVDDDVYINVRNLAHFLESYHDPDLSMFGSMSPTPADFFAHRAPELNNKTDQIFSYYSAESEGKWNISFEEWPWHNYPKYYLGPAVLIPGNTILPLLAAIQTTPMIPFDDVYYTGICTEKAGIQIYDSSRYKSVLSLEMPVDPTACHLRRYIAWMTDSEKHMNNSHVAMDKFLRNATRCVFTNSKGITRYFDHSQPVHMQFNYN